MQEKLIREGQGFRQNVYNCTQGHPTIGYGHKLTKEQKNYLFRITREEAEILLKSDMQKAKKQVRAWFGEETLTKIGPERTAVLVDMAYNLGSVRWPKLTRAIKQTDYQQAAHQILDSKYAKQVKDRAKRNAEIMRTSILIKKSQINKSRKIVTKQEVHKNKTDLFYQDKAHRKEDYFGKTKTSNEEVSQLVSYVNTKPNAREEKPNFLSMLSSFVPPSSVFKW